MPFKLKSLSLSLPFNLGSATIEIGEAERVAAWKLYVEFSTRVSSQPLQPGAGSVREALTSIYNLFGITREVLKEAGPDIGGSAEGLGSTAIRVINGKPREFLTQWHAAYSDYEAAEVKKMIKDLGLKSVPVELVDQVHWDQLDKFYASLEEIRRGLQEYIILLAKICGVEQPSSEEIVSEL